MSGLSLYYGNIGRLLEYKSFVEHGLPAVPLNKQAPKVLIV